MSYSTDNQKKFSDLKFILNPENKSQLSLKANGGNSILFVFSPEDEKQYIDTALDIFKDEARFIFINNLLIKYIDSIGWDDFKNYYSDYSATPDKIFKSDSSDIDLFDLIINEIEIAQTENKIPFLMRTGALFGTGIDNNNIMEHKFVREMKTPLVIFYPAKTENDSLLFLNFKHASKYRGVIVN